MRMHDLFHLSDKLLTCLYTWYDCWLEGDPLASYVLFINIMDIDKQVKDIQKDSTWDLLFRILKG